jgi:hypothetical protein
MKIYLLTVHLLINGQWVDGASVDGWAPRKVVSYVECERRRAFAEKQGVPYGADAIRWTCKEA